MNVRWVTRASVEERTADDLPELVRSEGGFVWVDVPDMTEADAAVLRDVFGFHPLAVRDCLERSHVPKVRAYADHVFAILHAPEPGDAGHVHLVELDQFVSLRYLVTTHGPLGDGVPLEAALRETNGVLERMRAGRIRPGSPGELSHAIVSGLAARMETFVSRLAGRIAQLERAVMRGERLDPEETLEEMFRIRHELLTVRTMAAQSREVHARMSALGRFLPDDTLVYVEDLADRFERVRSLCDGEKEFLQGVVDYHQSRTATKMNIAMERLALLAALVLPVTAVASIYGMNIIVNSESDVPHILGVLGVMGIVIVGMLRWAKRHGWW